MNNPYQRWAQYKSAAKHKEGYQIIRKSMTKNGIDNFSFDLIATCKTQEDVNETEKYLIKQYDSRNKEIGYNIDEGGNVEARSPEVCEKIGAALKEYYENHDGWNKGGTLSEEWRQNISIASMGKPGTNKGKQFSEEWKLNQSKALRGKEKKSQRRFTEEVELKICDLYMNHGGTTDSLAIKFGCGKSLIRGILIRNNIKLRSGKKYSDDFAKEACQAYVNGIKRFSDLGRKFNCAPQSIRRILERAGLVPIKLIKGVMTREEANIASRKLSLQTEKEIYEVYTKGDVSVVSLARKYECSENTIIEIIRRNK